MNNAQHSAKTSTSDWWKGGVIYQIYPRSFQDSSGDGIGDLRGITQRLDHIAKLGADAIWLSPIFTSPMDDMGYDVSNYIDIDPLFGTLADFDALIARAHELGIKVIIDQVISHSSDQHPFFLESKQDKTNPKADWYVWADPLPDGTPPNNWLSIFGGSAWTWNAKRRQYFMHNFLISQPDLNLHNPEVQDYLIGTMRFWLERGVDGFRLDTVNFYMHDLELRNNPPEPPRQDAPRVNPYDMQSHDYSKNRPENVAFLERLRALCDEFDDRAMVGEVGENHRRVEIMAEYTKGDNRLHMAYSFDMLDNFFTPAFYRDRIETFFKMAPDGWPCWSFSNHDVIRHVTRWAKYGAQKPLAKLAGAMLTSFPGSICLYQGEELGLGETDIEYHELTDPPGFTFWPDYKGRDGCRTPMPWVAQDEFGGFSTNKPWLPVKAPQAALAVDRQAGDPNSVLECYRALLAMRRNNPVFKGPDFKFHDVADPLLALTRGTGADAITAVFNMSPNAQTVTLKGSAQLTGPAEAATLDGTSLALGPNGFAFWTGGAVPA